ncbi:MAG: acetylxylan esterase, partial [Acidobacteria bacterium]|nr:acetylxylan esterase [Acidobacteriota bacterium]
MVLAVLVPAAPAAPRDWLRLYDYDPKAPLEVVTNGIEQRPGAAVHDISYASPKGGRITAYLVVPQGKGPFAGMLFMHGGNGSRSSLLPGALLYAKAGAVCLLIDSPLNGARSKPGERLVDLTKPEQTRDAMIQTIIDLRRGIDLLLARADVDPARLGYIGASYGGIIGGVLAGVEKRIKAYALLVGGGSFADFIRASEHPNAVRTRQALTPEQLRRNLEILEPLAAIHYIGD